MNPEALSAALLAVIAPLAEARRPGAADGLTAADLVLDRPKNREHGDWSSNAALKLANEAFAPISGRISLAAEKISKAA